MSVKKNWVALEMEWGASILYCSLIIALSWRILEQESSSLIYSFNNLKTLQTSQYFCFNAKIELFSKRIGILLQQMVEIYEMLFVERQHFIVFLQTENKHNSNLIQSYVFLCFFLVTVSCRNIKKLNFILVQLVQVAITGLN